MVSPVRAGDCGVGIALVAGRAWSYLRLCETTIVGREIRDHTGSAPGLELAPASAGTRDRAVGWIVA